MHVCMHKYVCVCACMCVCACACVCLSVCPNWTVVTMRTFPTMCNKLHSSSHHACTVGGLAPFAGWRGQVVYREMDSTICWLLLPHGGGGGEGRQVVY